jgi:hypothetical protein
MRTPRASRYLTYKGTRFAGTSRGGAISVYESPLHATEDRPEHIPQTLESILRTHTFKPIYPSVHFHGFLSCRFIGGYYQPGTGEKHDASLELMELFLMLRGLLFRLLR